ncbi:MULTISPECIES: HPP family protein [unclassified Sphingomonas]|uniref:HPP family protein n=1 Tax=unclassified Sphingomonas TaxID=196159 RepID=UPI00160980F2|nr:MULTISPECIES: HPP family protein [unclassified Sphingomonas]MBB3348034.1 CBS domain-containing membrane protein [Sphingomonas sp. BK069]MBB3473885.1 CBS domain-containing membrane protein [Sphingomonas sp. BK345]
MPSRLFKPLLSGAHFRERLIACVGAAIGIALTALVCAVLPLERADLPLIVAPLGASAVLVFAVPASPLAQPWPVIGGNTLSALVGVAVYRLVPGTALAAGVAAGSAILVMSLLRCLHPPGGAAALTAVIGGPAVHAAGFGFALLPVALNSLTLVGAGLLFHRATARSYPHRAAAPVSAGLHAADIDAALADLHETFDIAPEDLDALLTRAEWHAAQRRAAPATAGSTARARRGTPVA